MQKTKNKPQCYVKLIRYYYYFFLLSLYSSLKLDGLNIQSKSHRYLSDILKETYTIHNTQYKDAKIFARRIF